MANKSTTAKVSRKDGLMTVQQHETDSPILAVPQLEHLHTFRPDVVDWVIQQTQIESEFRRDQIRRVNRYTFTGRILGQIFAFLIGISGIAIGAYVSINNQPWAGATIASLSITGLAAVFLTGKLKN